jgi:hypothetical protein
VNRSFFSSLAAAYAETGNFTEAVRFEEKAISMLKGDDRDIKESLLPELEFYKANKPWREDVKREDWMLKYKVKK